MRWRRWRQDEDFHQEIEAHLDLEADQLVNPGATIGALVDRAHRADRVVYVSPPAGAGR